VDVQQDSVWTLARRQAQFEKLDALQTWCRATGKPLLVEILVARRNEAEEEFEAAGRPAMLAGFIAEAYRRRLEPAFWKIEGTVSPQGSRTIDDAVAANPRCRQIILGKAADVATIDGWFRAAASSRTAVGFAIGRSVFWAPSIGYLTGAQSARNASDMIAENYLQLVDGWQKSRV